MLDPHALKTLSERRDYLSHRIEAKRSMKPAWDTQHDENEYWALCLALKELADA